MHHVGSDEEESDAGMPELAIGTQWEAIGPFPSGMREHPLTATPLSAFTEDDSIDPDVDMASRAYDESETFPSEMGFGGRVGWKRFTTGSDGWTEVEYPEIRWDQLREDHGWAALQYQVVLRTDMTVPELPGHDATPLLVDLIQGTEFALVPKSTDGHITSQSTTTSSASATASGSGQPPAPVTWYNGDVYDFSTSPTGSRHAQSKGKITSNFARSLTLPPGDYTVLVRAMYEIRMFGDPGVGNARGPVIRFCLQGEVDTGDGDGDVDVGVEVMDGLAIIPDVVDSFLMGDHISVPLRSRSGKRYSSIQIVGVNLTGEARSSVDVSLANGPRVGIVEGQTRPIAIRLNQHTQLKSVPIPLEITFDLLITSTSGTQKRKSVKWNAEPTFRTGFKEAFRITFASPATIAPGSPVAQVSYAMVLGPDFSSGSSVAATRVKIERPVILALHGAGVDVAYPFWASAIPLQGDQWAVLPTGHNEWGEDWHGGSMADVWSAREALPQVLRKLNIKISDKTLLIGHSNGGQGAWHLAARYPDRIVAMIAASGWLKIQDYVPYQHLTSGHYADPALMGILFAALTPYNNDLYASNLAHIPLLAVHGSDDSNVPPRHGREHVALVQAWERSHRPVKMVEVPKEDHWWQDVFKSEGVQEFMENLPDKPSMDVDRTRGFTLTTANPEECGGRAGIRIVELAAPGRLARLDVNARQWRGEPRGAEVPFHGMNVKRFSVMTGLETKMYSMGKGSAATTISSNTQSPRAYGPMIRLLATSAPMILVIKSENPRHFSLAMRIAHDLYLYHRLDTEIISDEAALLRAAEERLPGNVVAIGSPFENDFTRWLVAQKRIPLKFPAQGVIEIAGRDIWERAAGIITLHPHPTSVSGLACIIAGNDDEGLELAARLFPMRTGVPIPDWAIVSPRSKWQGAGGFIGAGFWDGEWGWSESMSWIDRS